MNRGVVTYQGYWIDPQEFWAMMFGCAKIDGYGREVNADGEPIMSDKLRYVLGRSREHRRWPLCEISDPLGGIVIQEEYDRLDPVYQAQCKFRLYLSIMSQERERYRIYNDDNEAICELISQSILNGSAPFVRIIKEIHGEDCNGNSVGRLYPYRETILDCLWRAIKLGPYWFTGATEWLLNQARNGYIGSVEHYQLAWLQSVADNYMSDIRLRDLGVPELELLRQFVSADAEVLADWFNQSLDDYRSADGRTFPAIIGDQVVYQQDAISYSDYTDGQLEYLIEHFQPAVITRLQQFFREYGGIIKGCFGSEDIQQARERLRAALKD